ncbi:DUF4214 domain-containing protein, partial [Roseibium hamelinense]
MSTTVESQISSYFTSILKREPDSAGLAGWVSAVADGNSLDDVRAQFVNSAEADAIIDPLVRLYEAAFGRVPDDSGLEGWAAQVRAGSSIQEIAAGFTGSAEFAARYPEAAQGDLTGFVTALYQQALGRAPDAEGLQGWITSGLSTAEILVGFSNSPEFQSRSDANVSTYLSAVGQGNSPSPVFSLFALGSSADLTGDVIDGKVAGATVGIDLNGDGIIGPDEPTVTTDSLGNFSFPDGTPLGNLIATEGTDISTGLPFTGKLEAPSGSTVVTPLTTMVKKLADQDTDTSKTDAEKAADAQTQLKGLLGLSSITADLTTTDFVAEAGEGDPNGADGLSDLQAAQLYSASAQILNLVAQGTAAITGADGSVSDQDAADAVFNALASALAGQGGGSTVDLTSTSATDADASNDATDLLVNVINSAASGAGLTGDALTKVESIADSAAKIAAAANKEIDEAVDGLAALNPLDPNFGTNSNDAIVKIVKTQKVIQGEASADLKTAAGSDNPDQNADNLAGTIANSDGSGFNDDSIIDSQNIGDVNGDGQDDDGIAGSDNPDDGGVINPDDTGGAGAGGGGAPADTSAPVFTSGSVFSVDENTLDFATVAATDNAAVSYGISGGVDAAAFDIDTSTGELSFATAPDHETPADDNGDNLYEVTVSATDASGNTTTQEIEVTVNNTIEVGAPGAEYTTIQAAIAAASSGDTIVVKDGTYTGPIEIDVEGLTLVAAPGADVTITGFFASDYPGATVAITADNVRLEGFTIDNGFDIGNTNGRAIAPTDTSGSEIVGNTLTNAFRGIQGDFYGRPEDVTITENTFDSTVSYGLAGTEDMSILDLSGNIFNTSVEGIGLGVGVDLPDAADTVAEIVATNTFSGTGNAVVDYQSGAPLNFDADGNIVVADGESIQDAIDGAPEGATIVVEAGTYSESLTIDKAVTLVGQPDLGGNNPVIDTGGAGIQITGDINNGGAASIAISGFDFAGNTAGVSVHSSTQLDSLLIDGSNFDGNSTHGIIVNSVDGLAAISVTNSSFTDNGQGGSNGSGDLVLFDYQGAATIDGVSFTSTRTDGDPAAGKGDTAIQIAGFEQSTYDVSSPIGTVQISNVSVQGSYHKNHIAIQGFTDLSNASLSNVSLDGSSNWGYLVFIDPVASSGLDTVGNSGYPGNFAGGAATETLDLSGVSVTNGSSANLGFDVFIRGTDADNTQTGTGANDFLNALAENDTDAEYGTDYGGDDTLSGLGGDDQLFGGEGDDTLNGGEGEDIALFSGSRSDYTIIKTDIDTYSVIDNNAGNGDEGTDTLVGIENARFDADNAIFALDVSSPGDIFDQLVIPEVIFGSGNANGSFTANHVISTPDGHAIELGLRAKLRFDETNQPQNEFNSNGDGTYTFDTGTPPTGFSFAPGAVTTPIWNFEWTINTDIDGSSGKTLDDYIYLLEIDGDPSAATDFGTGGFDPINVVLADHAMGTNTTTQSSKVSAADETEYAGNIASLNVAQNSWNYEFFNGADGLEQLENFDPTDAGIYTIQLSAFDGDELVS